MEWLAKLEGNTTPEVVHAVLRAVVVSDLQITRLQMDWKAWYANKQVAGYATIYKAPYPITFTTIKGSGYVRWACSLNFH